MSFLSYSQFKEAVQKGLDYILPYFVKKAEQDGKGNVIADTYATKTDVNGKIDSTGGTMTGDLTVGNASIGINGYVKGTWLQTTSATDVSTPGRYAVVNNGWIYTMTPEAVKANIIGSGTVTDWDDIDTTT